MEKLYKKTLSLINDSEKILIVSHRKPDADTLGAAIALRQWLIRTGKDVVISCYDRPSKTFNFLPFIDHFVSDFVIDDFDLVIVVDAGASYMTNFHLKYDDFFTSNVPMINIDHHASNDHFGDLNIVDVEAASVTVILFKMFQYFIRY